MEQEKKSVGIITMHRVINYGSALQTYATVKTVEKLGFLPTVIDYDYPTSYHIKYAVGCENVISPKGIKKIVKLILKIIGLLDFVQRIRARLYLYQDNRRDFFKQFIEHLPLTQRYNRKNILKKPPKFDIYMTGSDQTWNPRYLHRDYSFLLNFAPKEAPRISYAASFGSSELAMEYQDDYRQYLSCYDRISVRESSGVKLVDDLCNKKAVHVLDPTLLLNHQEWKTLIAKTPEHPKHFIFCYCLSYVFEPAPEIFDLLKYLQTLLECHVLFFADTIRLHKIASTYNFQVIIPSSPASFIALYSNAQFIVSTSFHGTAFAVNFNKDFYAVLNPNFSKDDRVRNFLDSVGLTSRGLNLKKTDVSKINAADLQIDYRECNQKLEELRKYSLDYLSEALDFASQKCATKDE